jgi:hypothetical protein
MLFRSLLGQLLLASLAVAAPVCSVATLENYATDGFTCEIDGAVFSDFSFSSIGGSPPVLLTASEITVNPVSGFNYLGLRFDADFLGVGLPNGPGPAEGLRNSTYRIFYTVRDPTKLFNIVEAEVDGGERFAPNPLKFGGYLAAANVTNDGALAIVDFEDVDQLDLDPLNSIRSLLNMDTTLSLTGGASAVGSISPVGFVSFQSMETRLLYEPVDVVIPEPNTLSLIGLTLLAFPAIRYLRRS